MNGQQQQLKTTNQPTNNNKTHPGVQSGFQSSDKISCSLSHGTKRT